MSATPFIFSEERIGEAIGLSRKELRRFRRSLTEGEDWQSRDSEILLSNKGVERLAELCGGASSVLLAYLKDSSEKKNGAPKKMRVALIPDNTRMVVAVCDALPGRHLIFVGNSATLVMGDELEAVPYPEAGADVWKSLTPLPRDRRRLPKQ